jgi:hypothetical protein
LTAAVLGAIETACKKEGRTVSNDARINLGAGLLSGTLPGSPPDATLTAGILCTFSIDVILKGDIQHFKGAGRMTSSSFRTKRAANYKVILDTTEWAPKLKEYLLAGRGETVTVGAGGRTRGGHPFGQDRHYVRDWFLR